MARGRPPGSGRKALAPVAAPVSDNPDIGSLSPEADAESASVPPFETLARWQRENPNMLAGDDLHRFAMQRGMARSALATMDDQKVRVQLRKMLDHVED